MRESAQKASGVPKDAGFGHFEAQSGSLSTPRFKFWALPGRTSKYKQRGLQRKSSSEGTSLSQNGRATLDERPEVPKTCAHVRSRSFGTYVFSDFLELRAARHAERVALVDGRAASRARGTLDRSRRRGGSRGCSRRRLLGGGGFGLFFRRFLGGGNGCRQIGLALFRHHVLLDQPGHKL